MLGFRKHKKVTSLLKLSTLRICKMFLEEGCKREEVVKVLCHLNRLSDVLTDTLFFLEWEWVLEKRSPRFVYRARRALGALLHKDIVSLSLRYEFLKENERCIPIVRKSLGEMSNLTSLDISSICDDETALILGAHCTELHTLRVSDSHGLTDTGIQGLIGLIRSRRQNVYRIVSGCKKLRVLHADNCPGITVSQMVSAVMNLPFLKILEYDGLSDVFTSSAIFESGQRYRLTRFEHVTSCVELYNEGNINHYLGRRRSSTLTQLLARISEICPDISSTKIISNKRADDDRDLVGLLRMKRLCDLDFEFPGGSLGFGLKTFLLNGGSRLKSVKLRAERIPTNIIQRVFQDCPSLEILHIFATEFVMEDEIHYTPIEGDGKGTHTLKELCLGQSRTIVLDGPNEYVLNYILSMSPMIKNINLSSFFAKILADDCLKFKSLEYLQALTIFGEYPIPVESILRIFRHCYNLKFFGYSKGSGLNYLEKKYLEQRIGEENRYINICCLG